MSVRSGHPVPVPGKNYKQKYTFCAEESEQQHERAACYCSAQLIKRVKNRMTTVVISAILNPVSRVSTPH